MSVSRRVILSVAVLMLLALGVLSYELYVVNQIQSINAELSGVKFRAARNLTEMKSDIDEIEQLSKRYVSVVALRDPDRARLNDGLNYLIEGFNGRLMDLESPPEASGEIALLSTAWTNFRNEMEIVRQTLPKGGTDELPTNLAEAIKLVRQRTNESREAVLESMEGQVKSSQDMGDRAASISLAAAALFLVLGSTVTYWTLRSINAPLHQLTRGTRTIANGEFSHRLPVDGPLEFAELARDFNSMSEKLGELDQMKKDFVAHVSHELKAPLAAIRQTLAVTLEQVPGPINDAQRRLLQLSRQSAERLSAIVANLLDVSRLEAGTMEYEMGAQDILGIVRQVVDEFSLKAQERQIELTVNSDAPTIPVICDGDRMIQVIGNLVDNALKFSPTNSKISIEVSHQNVKSASMATVSIADRGTGVPDDHKQNVFQKFHQVKGRGKRAAGQGVGLGLAICKTIMDAHRGRIWVEDNQGGGSVFRLEMRAAQAPVSKEAAKCV
jgi:signal transduction histidine kinase